MSRAGGGYRPQLDGVRAVAVYLVVLFHAGSARFVGGYLGVDMFFVLSGYLVTQVLTRDLDSTGSIRFGRFYARRARRLLPAAAVALVGAAVIFAWIGSPTQWSEAEDGIRAAALYVANWFFIARSQDYFAAEVETSPVLHFWSLSVEEQFYLAWPVLLYLLVRLARVTPRPRRVLQASVAAIAGASLVAALALSGSDPNRAYFGTDTRAYQLLAGALLALTPGLFVRIRANRALRVGCQAIGPAALLAILLLSSWLVDLEPIRRGALAAAATAALIVGLDATGRGLLVRGFSLPPIVYLGRISYGTYLWHWPVLLVAFEVLGFDEVGATVVAVVVATSLAALSYQLVEMPIRSWEPLDRRPLAVVASGITLSVLVALVLVPVVFERAESQRDGPATAVSSATSIGGVDLRTLDWESADEIPTFPDCRPRDLDRCFIVREGGQRVLVLGDSHAGMYIPMFEAIGEELGLDVAVAARPKCSWLLGTNYGLDDPECTAVRDDWYGPILEGIDPDLVVLAARTIDDEGSPVVMNRDGETLEVDDPDFAPFVRERTEATVDQLRARGYPVAVIEPAPQPRKGEDALDCLSDAEAAEECRFVYQTFPSPQEQVLRGLDEGDDGVWSVDLDPIMCPYLPICDPVVDGVIARRDGTHITIPYAVAIAPDVATFLVDRGVLTP